jgi:putative SOS response-associated peptidase YedK
MKDGKPFGLAGLWERRKDGQGVIECCVFITTVANSLVRRFQPRMPAIIDPEHYDLWLDPGAHDMTQLHLLLVPYPASEVALVSTP